MSAAVQAAAPAGAGSDAEVDVSPAGDVYARATRVVASVAVAALGTEERVGYGATTALPLAIVLLPLWLPVLRRHALAPLIAGLAALSAVSGVVLSELSSVDHVISEPNRIQAIGLLASGIAAFGLLLWAGSQLPLHRIAVLYGAGALAATVAGGELSWKYNLAIPTTLVVLGALERRGTAVLPAVAVLALGVAGVADEARSYFGVCVLAAALTVWQLRPRVPAGDVGQPGEPGEPGEPGQPGQPGGPGQAAAAARHRWFPVALLAGLGLAVYAFTTALATGGTLGETLQERSNAQISGSGSLIAGGRPEWAATRELVQLNPAGYGVGVVPNWADRTAGKTGLASIDVDAGGYADNYMFGGRFELHSVAADLWVGFGWVGVALAAAMVIAIVRSLSFLLAARQAPTYVTFAGILALWYVLFGPMYSNWLDVCAALALAVVAVGPRPAGPPAERATP